MKLYNEKYLNIINDNLENIELKGEKERVAKLEPKKKEYDEVSLVILKYIEEKKRIIYGGKCWEALLQFKNKNEKIYNEYAMSDFEFYSFEPLVDMKELCDLLHDKGFKYVEGFNAQHEETYKVRVNYLEYCDITYMPKIIYSKMPKIKINNIFYSGFNFVVVDILRMFNDPLSSYWRITKNGKRALKLFKYYSLNLNPKFNIIDYNKEKNILDFIRKKIIIDSKLIVIGYFAFEYFKQKNNKDLGDLYVPYYEVISDDIINFTDNVCNILKQNFNNIIKKEYRPFFQFLDKKFSFFYNNKKILTIYGNNNYCVPYIYLEKKNINIGSYNVVLMYLIINSIYYDIYINKEKNNIDFLIKNLIENRNLFLNSNNKPPLDNTPFEEFFVNCIGNTFNSQIRFFQIMDKRNTKYDRKNMMKQRYHPDVSKKFDFSKYNFNNTSGREK